MGIVVLVKNMHERSVSLFCQRHSVSVKHRWFCSSVSPTCRYISNSLRVYPLFRLTHLRDHDKWYREGKLRDFFLVIQCKNK